MLAQQPWSGATERFQCFIMFILTGEIPSTTITEFASSQAHHLMHCQMNPKWLWDSRRPLRKGSLQGIIELRTIGCEEPGSDPAKSTPSRETEDMYILYCEGRAFVVLPSRHVSSETPAWVFVLPGFISFTKTKNYRTQSLRTTHFK